MIRIPILRIVPAGVAVPFIGCLSGTGTSTEHQPTGPAAAEAIYETTSKAGPA